LDSDRERGSKKRRRGRCKRKKHQDGKKATNYKLPGQGIGGGQGGTKLARGKKRKVTKGEIKDQKETNAQRKNEELTARKKVQGPF